MRRVDRVVEDLKDFLSGKILEVACGEADFSLAVSEYADFVCGIDTSLTRLERKGTRIPDHVHFQKMDAAHLGFKDESFDVIVGYNTVGHLVDILDDCVFEMIRVLKSNRFLVFITTWKMDRALIPDVCTILASFAMQNVREIKNTYCASIWKKL